MQMVVQLERWEEMGRWGFGKCNCHPIDPRRWSSLLAWVRQPRGCCVGCALLPSGRRLPSYLSVKPETPPVSSHVL